MPYQAGGRLPMEMASKLGHLDITQSKWVKSLVESFESPDISHSANTHSDWEAYISGNDEPLPRIWAVDGSLAVVRSEQKISKEVAFVKTALMSIDFAKLEKVDKRHPHPLMLQTVMKDSAIFHSTVFPLRNVASKHGSNYDAIRHIIFDSIRLSEDGVFFETLKWLSFQKWTSKQDLSPSFQCPHCDQEIQGLSFDQEQQACPLCSKTVFLTDMLGFHLMMGEDSAPDAIATSYMMVMEHLMLFTAIRIMWKHSQKKLVSENLFIKDGPLTMRGQFSKIVPNIRSFLQFASDQNRPIHIIGQEKTGYFKDHLDSIVMGINPKTSEDPLHFKALTHRYVHEEVYRTPDNSNPYGLKTNWGEKVLVKTNPGHWMVLNVPTGAYSKNSEFPKSEHLIGLPRILATIPSLISYKFEGAIYPIELANGIASLSSYPSAKILQKFLEDSSK